MAQPAARPEAVLRVAIAGNPNAGKSSIFNGLTGLRQKVGNYPGVTVERKAGRCRLEDTPVEVIDLPGAYSLTVQSPDEEVARDVLLGWYEHEAQPDVVVVVVDATSLHRNLFLATQIIELGYPTVIALNMTDLARSKGLEIDPDALARRLGVPVVATVASKGTGLDRLKATILEAVASDVRAPLEEPLQEQVDGLAETLAGEHRVDSELAPAMALRLLASPHGLDLARGRFGPELSARLAAAREALLEAGIPWQGCEAASRYPWLSDIVRESASQARQTWVSRSDRIDRVLTHHVFGPVVFLFSMALVFQSIYTWSAPFMDAIDAGTSWLGDLVRGVLAPGVLTDLLVDGVITGVGSVLIFLPQIVFLFFFLAMLEDTGYMARAAFVMDRIMSKVGLHGRSFVPLLSSFACAIPGIMAARTIGSRRDRLTTILVAPLITCSARLPVYALLIAAFVPQRKMLGGFVSTQGLALLSLYLLGILGALTVAAVLKRTILRGPTPVLLLELPSYRIPSPRHVLRDLWERAGLFLRFAGSVILSISIVLWFLAYFPRADAAAVQTAVTRHLVETGGDPSDAAQVAEATEQVSGGVQLEQSALGRMGRLVEPLVRPLGYDWRLGIGLLSSFAAREVMVSTMGIIFAVGEGADEHDATLIERLRQARRADGTLLFTLPVVVSLLLFYVFACQCMSTVGVVVRETGGWKWAGFMIAYMTTLAYLASLAAYQGLTALGVG